MERFPKIRFIIITILVITLINVVALALVLRFSFHEHRKEKETYSNAHANKGFDFLKEKLQLTPAQETFFKQERDSFFASGRLIFDALENKRLQMIAEIKKENPDTAILYHIAKEMGDEHGKLKKRVVDHFLKLRSYCTPDQITRLDSMYSFMIRTDSPWRKKSQEGDGNEKTSEDKKR
jgi:hypothetical protein